MALRYIEQFMGKLLVIRILQAAKGGMNEPRKGPNDEWSERNLLAHFVAQLVQFDQDISDVNLNSCIDLPKRRGESVNIVNRSAGEAKL